MTFSADSEGKKSYVGDDSTTDFPTGFKFILNSHVRVVLRASDVETVQVEGGDYTLTGATLPAGGTVSMTTAPATGETLVLLLRPPISQELALPLGGAFPSTGVEQSLDLAAMVSANLAEVDKRTLKVPESDSITGDALDLPIDADRAGKFLAFDQFGTPIPAVGTTGGLSPVSAFMDTVLPSADAAAARGTLGAQQDVITTRGDLIVGNATPVPARLARGAANRLLGADGNDIAYFGGTLAKTNADSPYAVVVGDHRKLILVDASAGAVTIDGDGAETINGVTTRTLNNQYDVESYRCDGSVWSAIVTTSSSNTQLLHVQDEKTQNTAGGTFTSGAWQTRVLNTVKTNEIVGASLAANQITLPVGTYYLEGSAPHADVDRSQTRLRNITDSADLLIGQPGFIGTGVNGSGRSLISGRFTLAAQKDVELQHRCSTTKATNGFGVEGDFTTEVYSVVKIWKV